MRGLRPRPGSPRGAGRPGSEAGAQPRPWESRPRAPLPAAPARGRAGAGRQGRPRGRFPGGSGSPGASRALTPPPRQPRPAAPRCTRTEPGPAGGRGRASRVLGSGLAPTCPKCTPGAAGSQQFRSSPPSPPVAAARPGAGAARTPCSWGALVRRLGQSREPGDFSLRGTGGSRKGPRPGRGRRPAFQPGSRPGPAPAHTRRRGTGCRRVAPEAPKRRPRRGAGPALTAWTAESDAPDGAAAAPLPRRPLPRTPRKQPLETEFPGGFLTRGRECPPARAQGVQDGAAADPAGPRPGLDCG